MTGYVTRIAKRDKNPSGGIVAMATEKDQNEKREVELDDVIILLMGAPAKSPALQDRIEGITRLEKLVFLLERDPDLNNALALAEDAEFRAHNFGPFSSKIYQAVDSLAAYGLIDDSKRLSSTTEDTWETEELLGTDAADRYSTRNLALTEKGKAYYKALLRELADPESARAALEEFKGHFGALPLRQLIRYVYSRYPDFATKSLIRHEVL